MAVRHADPNELTVSKYFAQNVTMLYEVYKLQDPDLEWLQVLEELCTFDVFFLSPSPSQSLAGGPLTCIYP